MYATVKDYLNQYPDTGLDLLTPVGLVKIPPRTGRELLAPDGGRMKFPVCGANTKVIGSDLLEQHICKIVSYRGDPWRVFMLTNLPSALSRNKYRPEQIYEQTSFLSE